jgi:hypothetical protein
VVVAGAVVVVVEATRWRESPGPITRAPVPAEQALSDSARPAVATTNSVRERPLRIRPSGPRFLRPMGPV